MKKTSDSGRDKKPVPKSDLARFLSGQMPKEEIALKRDRLMQATEGVARLARANMKRLGLSDDDEIDDTPGTLPEAMKQVGEDDAVREVVEGLIEEIKKRYTKK